MLVLGLGFKVKICGLGLSLATASPWSKVLGLGLRRPALA